MLNRSTFFGRVRSSLFGGTLSQSQVDGMTAMLDGWEKSYQQRTPLTQLAYCLATAFHETNRTMQPVHESGNAAYFTRLYDVQGANPARARAMGNAAPGDGALYCGRGLVQLTWRVNYAKATDKLHALGLLDSGESLVTTPDLAMRMEIAVPVMFEGMEDGWFTGVDLDDTIDAIKDGDEHADFVKARRIINGTDRAELIAGYGDKFLTALSA